MRILSLLVVLLLASVGAEAQTWTTYTSEAGHYRIDMPGVAQEITLPPLKLSDGVHTITGYSAEVLTESGHYIVAYSDLPAGNVPAAKLLEITRDNNARSGRLVRDKQITVSGNPGLEYVITRAGPMISVTRGTLVGHRLYLMSYATAGQTEPTSPDVQRFLDSFTLK